MKQLYIECMMGAAGDMLAAALLDLLPEPERFIEAFNQLPLPGVELRRSIGVKCGISGTQLSVLVGGVEEASVDCATDERTAATATATATAPVAQDAVAAPHDEKHAPHTDERSYASIAEQIAALPLSEQVKRDSLAVYRLIAEAEASVHRVPVEDIHFHELGRLDALSDILAVSMLLEELEVERIWASPIHVGSGHVRCSHGVLPVPAPATAELLKGVPTYGGALQGELCTPTGAALLKYFVGQFGPRPVMSVQRIGYGMGKKDFERANCVRVFLADAQLTGAEQDEVLELQCNLDDMSGEELAFAMERLLEEGALDVYLQPILMKKGRPAQILACLCKPEQEAQFLSLMLRYSSSFGVRMRHLNRGILKRREQLQASPLGPVRCKIGDGYGLHKEKYEYQDLAQIAKRENCSIAEVRARLLRQRGEGNE